MFIKEIWRYPVKSMAGERLREASLDGFGIAGDRMVHVEDAQGRWITSRSHPRLLGLRARLGDDGEPLVDGKPWSSSEVRLHIEQIVGPNAQLLRNAAPDGFDILPLLVATDGAIAAFGHDGRRLRPNIVIGGVEGLAERTWPGKFLKVGEVLIWVQDLRSRCVMTTYDPDTLVQDPGVLRSIVARFDGKLALNCAVQRSGLIHEGDSVELVSGT